MFGAMEQNLGKEQQGKGTGRGGPPPVIFFKKSSLILCEIFLTGKECDWHFRNTASVCMILSQKCIINQFILHTMTMER